MGGGVDTYSIPAPSLDTGTELLLHCFDERSVDVVDHFTSPTFPSEVDERTVPAKPFLLGNDFIASRDDASAPQT